MSAPELALGVVFVALLAVLAVSVALLIQERHEYRRRRVDDILRGLREPTWKVGGPLDCKPADRPDPGKEGETMSERLTRAEVERATSHARESLSRGDVPASLDTVEVLVRLAERVLDQCAMSYEKNSANAEHWANHYQHIREAQGLQTTSAEYRLLADGYRAGRAVALVSLVDNEPPDGRKVLDEARCLLLDPGEEG